MVHGNIFETILKIRVVLSLPVLLLGSFFIAPSWGMDPPPFPEKKSIKPKKHLKDEKNSSPEKKRSGARSKFTNLKDKFASKPKSKPKAEVEDKPTGDSGTPFRRRAATVAQSSPTPSSAPSTPSFRQRTNTVLQAEPGPDHRKRSNSLTPSVSKPFNAIKLQKRPQPEILPITEKRFQKLITSVEDMKKAVTPDVTPDDHQDTPPYGSVKIITIPNDPLNHMEIPFQQLFPQYPQYSQYSKIKILDIQGLILEDIEVDEKRMQNFVTALRSMLLEKLALNQCGINESGMKSLASILFRPVHAETEGIYIADKLRVLELCSNKIDDLGVVAITKALRKNSTLANLKLSCNQISDRGAIALASLLAVNSPLKELDLSLNVIGDEGIDVLAQALEKNSTLRNLHLGGNQIGDNGARSIGKLLADNTILKAVHLTEIQVTGEGIVALLKSLNKRSNLMLYLQDNAFELESNYKPLFFEDFSRENVSLIREKQLALVWKEDSLYCRVFGKEKIKIPNASRPAQGLSLEVLNNIAAIIQTFLKNGEYDIAAKNLAPFKKKILRFVSGIGYAPLINNDLQQYKDLMLPFAANKVHVYLPEIPPPYKAKRLDESE